MSRTRERYARMMATFWRNPRVRKLSDAAIATYCLALSYACDQLNDGVLAAQDALLMCARGKKQAIRELVTEGFWVDHGESYEIANYLEHNESREDLEAARRQAIRDGKRGGRPKGSGNRKQKGTLSETYNGTLTENETHGDGDVEPPLRVGAAEVSRTLSERVLAHMALIPTPGSVIRLLDMLSMLHCKANGAPYAEPGMPSENDKKALAKLIEQARRDSAVEGIEPMAVIGNRWLALLALVANGDAPPLRNPLAYFAKCFGNLEVTRSEAGAPFPVARTLEAVA